jgi:hypothetical protein
MTLKSDEKKQKNRHKKFGVKARQQKNLTNNFKKKKSKSAENDIRTNQSSE